MSDTKQKAPWKDFKGVDFSEATPVALMADNAIE